MINKTDKSEINKANALVNKYLCAFIFEKFLIKPKNQKGIEVSQNQYAKLCGLSSSTITKLKESAGYDIPMSTIYNICRHEKYSLQEFFKEFEIKYGVNIPL
ncbi:hypothetical protein AREALGSMS7_04115 [Arenibacter algicola]|jgi:uncharacterized protein YpuA (DUF1002 family)|uniref:Helix-turn-helix protein n=1 Tax=Arenibacter algicola TaxID=616991 RepID=A0A221V1V8_9FLAO|nr:hypothetical protein AREALGSMS7_04115 [Arenibacter algicola]